MKKQGFICTILSGSLLLSGCSSMLARSYTSVTPHSAAPVVESDQLTIRAESYQDLVNALLYFITQGRQTGTIRLYNYPYDVKHDLGAACREVTQEDPLGAYAVQDVSYNVVPVVSCYEATVSLSYRRTPQQISSIVSATGVTSIRNKLRDALSAHDPTLVLRINYFEEDEQYLLDLAQEAYFSAPDAALGFPQTTLTLFPESGSHRIAEFSFTYSFPSMELQRRTKQISQKQAELLDTLPDTQGDSALLAIYDFLHDQVEYLPSYSSTAYGALVEHRANSLGLALTVHSLCQQLQIPSYLVQGSLRDAEHCWVIVQTQDGFRHLDVSRTLANVNTSPFCSDREMHQMEYHWNTDEFPACGKVI